MKQLRLPIPMLMLLSVVLFAVLLAFMPTTLVKQIDDCKKIVIHCAYDSPNALFNGVTYEVDATKANYSSVESSCRGVMGVTVTANEKQAIKVLNSTKLIASQHACEMVVFYGYNKNIAGGVVIDGNVVNVQWVVRGDYVIMGSPLILGSY